mmetsp:Transcript_45019/g.106146  ORF Transcript_45019/g.106146 Transcript_45019/m.106146 type:complete len:244 (-) Transcript_45019:456-1187(-)
MCDDGCVVDPACDHHRHLAGGQVDALGQRHVVGVVETQLAERVAAPRQRTPIRERCGVIEASADGVDTNFVESGHFAGMNHLLGVSVSELPRVVGAPRVQVTPRRNSQRVLVAARYPHHILVLQTRYAPWPILLDDACPMSQLPTFPIPPRVERSVLGSRQHVERPKGDGGYSFVERDERQRHLTELLFSSQLSDRALAPQLRLSIPRKNSRKIIARGHSNTSNALQGLHFYEITDNTRSGDP